MTEHADPNLLAASLLFLLLVLALPVYWMLGKVDRGKVLPRAAGVLASMLWGLLVWAFNAVRDSGVLQLSTLASSTAGVLAPGDAVPHPNRHRDYLDYRGAAVLRELTALRKDGVTLGRFQHPRGSIGPAMTLPLDLLQRGCAVVGPSGSGKTAGVIVPWIVDLLAHGASVVTCDVKGDLIDRLRPEANRLGVRLWYWNSGDPARSQSWNWLNEVASHRDYESATRSILGRPRPGDTQPFFYERDVRWLRALIGVVKDAYGAAALPRYLYSLVGDQTALRTLFAQCPRVHAHSGDLADLFQFSPDEHSRAVSGLLNALHLFKASPVVAVSERSDFILSRITEAPTLLVVGAALADARLSEVMSALLINQLFNVVYSRFAPVGTGAPLYFVLDEAPRLKDRIHYEEVLSIVRGAGVGVCLAAQDVSQFGDSRAQNAILSNCLTFISLRGASADTARYFSSRLGQRNERSLMLTRNRGPFQILSQRASNAQLVTLPVLAEREIMHPPGPPYSGLVQVVSVSAKPFLVDFARTT